MPFLISLLLTPVVILLGTVLYFATLTAAGAPFPDARLLRDFATVGAIVGSILAAPVTLIVLPLACAILRRRGPLSPVTLAIIGGIAGAVVVPATLAVIVIAQNLKGSFEGNWLFAGLVADSALCSAICGALLALILNRLRPAS